MDSVIAGMPAVQDEDLMLCIENGIAYQREQDNLVSYDADYYAKCASYEGRAIAQRITRCRIEMVGRHYGTGRLVDVGVGSGEFIRSRLNTFGYDVNPVAIEWLKRNDLWAHPADAPAMTFWDVLEHVPDPGIYLRCVQLHGFVFTSIPVFEDLHRVRESKHYRPGEHLYYFKRQGFIDWMSAHGFILLEWNDHESQAGRESINSFAFKRNRWQK